MIVHEETKHGFTFGSRDRSWWGVIAEGGHGVMLVINATPGDDQLDALFGQAATTVATRKRD